MKIISWNVNGIRAVAKKWLFEFVQEESPDIFCIQETKAFESQVKKELENFSEYNYLWHAWERPWYAGTAIFYKNDIKVLETKNIFWEIEHFHNDWRVTQINFEKDWEEIVLINWYFPNGWTRADGSEMVTYKLEFYDNLIKYSNELVNQNKNVILTWDFNICHTEIDIARPKENKNSIWFLLVEREKVSELLDNWYIDTFRYFYPDQIDTYSWWSYRAWARPRNVGWRIDYFVVNKDAISKVKNIRYMNEVMWSDHCPVMLELK